MAREQKHSRRYTGTVRKLRHPDRLSRLEPERVVALCLSRLAASSALDVGCGSGVFAEAFAGRGLETAGLDPDPAMLRAARRHVPGASFVRGVAESLPLAERSFDVVFLGLVLHEADDPGLALREARRVARKRVAVLEWPYRREEAGPPLRHRLRPERILALARRAGLRRPRRIRLSKLELFLFSRD